MEVRAVNDEMFFSTDNKSLRRGKRRAARTETCRPCTVWVVEASEVMFHGVVVDVNPYGMCVRMMDSLPPGTHIKVQLMRDEDFNIPLAAALNGMVVRNQETHDGFVDHGVQLEREEIRPIETSKLLPAARKRVARTRRSGGQSRMHTSDIINNRLRGR